MRGTRALAGALGAGISLAIAGSLALLVVSSVIAFRGWPDDLSGKRAPEIARLSADPVAPSARDHIVALPSARLAGTPGDGAATRRPHRGASRRAASTGGVAASTTSSTGTTEVPAKTVATPSPSTSSTSGTTASAPAPVRPVTDAVTDTTKAVGDAVAPVAPSVGSALESVGAAGADAVDKVAGAVLP